MRLITTNLTSDSNTSVSASSANSNFPASNLKHEFRSKVWRSSGTFIVDSSNNKINFKESGVGSELTATITSGTYSVSGLQTEIKTQMESTGAETYSVSYSETTGKWTVSHAGSYLDLLNSTGTDAANSLLVNSLGFSSTDKTGATTYTGASIAIHTKERVTFDFGSTEDVDSIALLWPKEDGIKLSGSAVVKVEANASDSWSSPAVSQTLTIDNTYDLATHYFSTAQSYRYWSVTIEDPANANLYVELGVAFIGESLTIQEPENGFGFQLQDNSSQSVTAYGHRYVDEYPLSKALDFSYAYMDYSDVKTLENAFRTNSTKKPVFVTLDHDETVFDKEHLSLYGKFQSKFGLDHVRYNLFDTGLTIEEIS